MNLKAMVDIPVVGECVTRNGESRICRMSATGHIDGTVEIGFVSDRLKRSLHAGAKIRSENLDEFCLGWLRSRGKMNPTLNDSPEDVKGKATREALEEVMKDVQVALQRLCVK